MNLSGRSQSVVVTMTLLSAGVLLLLIAGTPASAQTDTKVARDTIVAWLRHGESLVRTVECRFKCVYQVTRPDLIPLIEAAVKNHPEISAESAIWTKEKVSYWQHSYVRHWWRKGVKEREEVFALADDLAGPPRFVRAFDGQIVRTVNYDDDRGQTRMATLKTAKSFYEINRAQPFSFVFEYYGVPCSQVVAQAATFSAEKVNVDGRVLTRVTLQHPRPLMDRLPPMNAIFFFDDQHRIVERQFIRTPLLGGKPEVCEKHAFMEYQAHNDASGETIWFPHKALYTYFLGRAPNGQLIDNGVKDFSILEIKFNTEIPDDKFQLSIPHDMEVLDEVSGLGWLQPGARPEWLFPEDAKAAPSSRAWIVWLLVVSILAITVVILWRKRKMASR